MKIGGGIIREGGSGIGSGGIGRGGIGGTNVPRAVQIQFLIVSSYRVQ